jgi:hypothetical protein
MTQLESVQPGDLITADFMNGLIDELTKLKGRVAILEGQTGPEPPTDGPVLTRREPVGDVRVGRLLALIGNNFAPVEKASVHLGNVTIESNAFTPDSNNTRLAFQVPAQFPTLPLSTKVDVETPQGRSGSLAVKVLEAEVTQGGKVFIDDQNTGLPKIEAGKTYTLTWKVRSETLQPATYDFELVFTGVDPASLLPEWEKAALSTTQEKISAGSPVIVTAEVAVPTGAKAASIGLRATSTSGQITNTSSAVTLTVGTKPDESDIRMQLFVEAQPPLDEAGTAPNPVQKVDGTIEVDFGATGLINIKVQPTQAGRYRFTSAIESLGQPARWATDKIKPVSAQVAAGATQLTVAYGVKNLGSATSPPPETFFIARAAKRNADDTADEYVSFIKFPIRGADVV